VVWDLRASSKGWGAKYKDSKARKGANLIVAIRGVKKKNGKKYPAGEVPEAVRPLCSLTKGGLPAHRTGAFHLRQNQPKKRAEGKSVRGAEVVGNPIREAETLYHVALRKRRDRERVRGGPRQGSKWVRSPTGGWPRSIGDQRVTGKL